ncbi:MAG TPA: beta-ketoacyl-ACP synthase II [Kiritimatiellia bacterium]|nr:beta-ketoacyl-ACP synthase II [Kiritimatiellia bacterium]HPO37752.1 beta-ketoacyl-ACP synthase II [Kiritimatiellia bacterium]HQL50472.1 beta-ketoacyl-ACP synthase II [Kiritimatiellia bacterium]HQQ91144.1 beta-ketoacyl-ACP synthase II [Kiritimatiellia bacterium]
MSGNTKVVITGLGVISPVGNTIDEMWTNIQNGVSGLCRTTKFDPARVDSKVSGEVKNFDVSKYVDPKEARRMGLFTQYALAAAKQAWQDAGLADGGADPERVAVMVGNGIGGKEVDEEGYHTLFERGPGRLSPMLIPKLIANEAAGNISIALKAKGAAHTVVTACASGTDALGMALDMIRAGRADVIIAGGTEATITEYCVGGFCSMKALSTKYNDTPERACRPFDAGRDGFVMAEGAAMLILETEAHAKARNARVYAEFAGYGASGDAYHLTAPDPEAAGAVRAIKAALKDAGLGIEDVDYVNAHGTSTPLNDPMETKAIKAVFGEHARRLKVSSTKSMTGHLLGAAGAIEAAICALAIRDGFYPPTINNENPDPECDLDVVPNKGVQGPIRAAISTSLGFGGHNGVIALKAYN